MVPLNTSAVPVATSTIGWRERGDRSMIASRRWPRRTGPSVCWPSASGPRRASLASIRAIAAASGAVLSKRNSPAMPHMSLSSSSHQRRLVHQRDLLAQFEDARLPVLLRIEPRKCGGESRVVPAPGEPGRIVDQPQSSECFDQMEFARVEIHEVLVAGQDLVELRLLFLALAGQQHPQILHRRSHAAVVEVDEMGPGVGPQHVAGMAVAVQADGAHPAGALIAMHDALKCVLDHAVPRGGEIGRQPASAAQKIARGIAEALEIECRPVRKARLHAHGVDAADKPSHPLQGVGAVELGHAAALFGIHGEAEAGVAVERGAVQPQRRHHGNLAPGQFGGEGVFVENRRAAPGCGTVELDHHRQGILGPHLVDAVFVAVERQQAAVRLETGAVQRVERAVGRQRGIGVGRIHHEKSQSGYTQRVPMLKRHKEIDNASTRRFHCRRMKTNDPFSMDISRHIWETRYRAAGEADIRASWRRVAQAIAQAEASERAQWAERFHALLEDFRFLPGGRILAGAGSGHRVTLFNCFVMGEIADDLEHIFEALKEGALTMQHGGGVGYDFSTLRPAGTVAQATGSIASGPVSFMHIWDAMCATMLSTGARRGAMMATLRCDHPDIERFVDAKRDPAALRHFNLSVLVSDAFMAAVADDSDWPLVFPGFTARTVKARDLWQRILRAAFDTAEPGVLFVHTINRDHTLADRDGPRVRRSPQAPGR